MCENKLVGQYDVLNIYNIFSMIYEDLKLGNIVNNDITISMILMKLALVRVSLLWDP